MDGDRKSRRGVPVDAWVALAVLMFLYILNTLDRNILSLIVDQVKRDLSIGEVQMSLLMGIAFALFYALCALPFGWLIDRYPRRPILFVGVVIWSLATIASGLAANFEQLLFARMFLGAGEAALAPSAHSILSDKFPKERIATALSVFMAGAVIGGSASIFIGGHAVAYFTGHPPIDAGLFGVLHGWQAVFVAVGVPGIAMAFLAFCFREPPRKMAHGLAAAAGRTEPLLSFLYKRRRFLTFFTGSVVLFSISVHGVTAWLPTHAVRHFGWTPAQLASRLGLLEFISMSGGILLGGMLVDALVARGYRDAHLRVFIGAVAIGAPLGVVAFLTSDVQVFIVCSFILKLTAFSYWGYGPAALQGVTTSPFRGRMAAVYLLLLSLIGGGGGPFLVAMLTERAFADPAMLGHSLALVVGVTAPIAMLSAWAAMRPMREAVADTLESEAQYQ